MKSYVLATIILFLSCQVFCQSVGINNTGSEPDSTAILDLSSLDQGFLMPRLHKNLRLGIQHPAQGLMVFDSTLNNLYFYRGNTWSLVGEDGPFKTFGSLIVQKENYDNDFIIGHPILPSTGPAVTENMFFFQESNGVFRAGGLNNSMDWHTVNMGDYSTAFGYNSRAKGDYSFSLGNLTESIGRYSISLGRISKANGDYSLSVGENNNSSGDHSVTFGENNVAEGNYSIIQGNNGIAPSYGEFVLGTYNTDYSAASLTDFNLSDRAMVIGSGNQTSRDDIFSIWKDGKVAIGHGNPDAKLDIFAEPGEDLIKVLSDNKNRMRLMSDGKFIIGGGSHVARLQANATFQEHAIQLKINGFQRFFVDSAGWTVVGANPPQAKFDVQAFNNEKAMNVEIAGERQFFIDADGQSIFGDAVPEARLHIKADFDEDPLLVKNNSTQRFFVNSDGQAIVGQNAPEARFDVRASSSEKAFNVEIDDTRTFLIDSDGQVVVGNAVADSRLQVNALTGEDAFRVRINGTTKLLVDANGGWTNYNSIPSFALNLENSATDLRGRGRAYSWNTYSDRRIKSNIRPLEYGLADLMKLNAMSYQHHTTNHENNRLNIENESSADIGLIAQEVHEVIPEAVSKPTDEENDLWTMDYTRLVPLLIKSIQEQQEMIEELRKEIELLKQD